MGTIRLLPLNLAKREDWSTEEEKRRQENMRGSDIVAMFID